MLDPPQLEAELKTFFRTQPPLSTEGITCDVCHKVVSINLQQDSDEAGKPYHDRPGVLSYNFLRPENQSDRIYVGPRVDVSMLDFSGINTDDSRITYSPVFSESKFCAACHYGKFWDTKIYNSFGEWEESSYAQDLKDKDNYKTCQDCHMTPGYLCTENTDR